MKLTLPQWYDLHMHLRQGAFLAPLVAAQKAMGCCGVLAMPNTKPPLAKVTEADPLPYDCIEAYLAAIKAAGGDEFQDILVPLYLTKDTTPEMILTGAASGLLRACKYYPPHGTTGADFGYPFAEFMQNGVFAAMEEAGVVLCIHGEEHGLAAEDYFDRTRNAEQQFYSEQLPRLLDAFPSLKVVAEHVTTRTAVELVQQADANVAATVTPQHLLYTVGHLLQGCRYHLYCLPLLKFADDRTALREAVTGPENQKFFAGTDSAPHTKKATECGCAAGCFTGGIAPQLYAQAFEESGVDLASEAGKSAFSRFLCSNGPDFYGLAESTGTFTLEKAPQTVEPLPIPGEPPVIPLPLGLGQKTIPWRIV